MQIEATLFEWAAAPRSPVADVRKKPSTLREYVRAIGGDLHVMVTFPVGGHYGSRRSARLRRTYGLNLFIEAHASISVPSTEK